MRKDRRTIFPHDITMYASSAPSSFLTWLKSVFWYGRRLAHLLGQVVRLYGSCDMEHAAPGSVLRASISSNASSGLPGPPAGGRGKDGRIHNDCSRYSPAAQREVASLYLCTVVITFCTSPRCVGVPKNAKNTPIIFGACAQKLIRRTWKLIHFPAPL